jgi:hypothetical protein
MKLMIKEDYNNSNKTIADFMNEIKAIYAKYFPNSSCAVSFKRTIGEYNIYISCYLAKNSSEVSNGIMGNDIFHVMFDIPLTRNETSKEDAMPENIELVAYHNTIRVKPENSYMFCSSLKVPFRKTKGTPDKVLKAFDKFVQRLYNTLKEQYDNNNLLDTKANNDMGLAKSKL